MTFSKRILLPTLAFANICLFPAFTSLNARNIQFQEYYSHLLNHALNVQAGAAGYAAKESIRTQAGLYPNPDLAIGLETIGEECQGDQNQLSVELTQLIEMGGKRAARLSVAEADQCANGWELQIAKQELYTQTLHAFIEMAIAQEKIALTVEQHKLSQEILKCTEAKAQAGKTSSIDTKKADLACKTAKLHLTKQQGALKCAKKGITSLSCSTPLEFECVSFPIYEITPLPALEELKATLPSNALIAKSQAEMWRAWQTYELEKANAIPDVAVQIGVSTEKFYKCPALNLGIDFPLPIFDQNQGNIQRAIYDYNQSYYIYMGTLNQLQSNLTVLYEEWLGVYEQITTIKEDLLPAAQESYDLAFASYQAGKTDYLTLLDAHSTLFDIKQQYLDALEEYHHKQADVLKLTSRG